MRFEEALPNQIGVKNKMKAISFSTTDKPTKGGDVYNYEHYTIPQARAVVQNVLTKYVKSVRVQTWCGITDFWYFDIDAYQKALDEFGYDIPDEEYKRRNLVGAP